MFRIEKEIMGVIDKKQRDLLETADQLVAEKLAPVDAHPARILFDKVSLGTDRGPERLRTFAPSYLADACRARRVSQERTSIHAWHTGQGHQPATAGSRRGRMTCSGTRSDRLPGSRSGTSGKSRHPVVCSGCGPYRLRGAGDKLS